MDSFYICMNDKKGNNIKSNAAVKGISGNSAAWAAPGWKNNTGKNYQVG